MFACREHLLMYIFLNILLYVLYFVHEHTMKIIKFTSVYVHYFVEIRQAPKVVTNKLLSADAVVAKRKHRAW